MTKEFGLGKRRKRIKVGDKRRENEHPDRHRQEQPSQRESGNSSRLVVALLCASAGLPVVPLHGVKAGLCTCDNEHCEQPGRHPRTEKGLQDATTDPKKIEQMWRQWPKAKVAIALSPQLVAVVVEGKAGREELQKLKDEK